MDKHITKDMLFGKRKDEISDDNIIEKMEIVRQDIPLDKLVDYRRGQPFSIYSKEKMEEMKQSIINNGVIVAITVRPIEDDKYEILSGHNRVKCCQELSYKTISANIVECDDDRATLIMLETNLCQRESIPLSEKGEAYKQKLEILLRHEKDGDLIGHERKIESLANISEDSKTQIQRLIRLTYLINEFKEKVNNFTIPFYAGVDISYIDSNEQEKINKVIDAEKINITINQASKLRELKGTLREEVIKDVLVHKNKDNKFTGKLNRDNLKKYKSNFKSNEEFNKLINKLLEQYFETKC